MSKNLEINTHVYLFWNITTYSLHMASCALESVVYMNRVEECPKCGGKGYMIKKNKGYPLYERVKCEGCHGSGIVKVEINW